jgi:hypothetical protein
MSCGASGPIKELDGLNLRLHSSYVCWSRMSSKRFAPPREIRYNPGACVYRVGFRKKSRWGATFVGSVWNLRSRDGRAWLRARVTSCRALAAAAAALALPATRLPHQTP